MAKAEYTVIPPSEAQTGDLLKFQPNMKPGEVWTWRSRDKVQVWKSAPKFWTIIEVQASSDGVGLLALVNRSVDGLSGKRKGEDDFVWIRTDGNGISVGRRQE